MSMRRETWSDSRRDAVRYDRLLLALDSATDEIRNLERIGQPDLTAVLSRLLPDLTEALNAREAFVAQVLEDVEEGAGHLKITTTRPQSDLCGRHIPLTDLLEELVLTGDPVVRDSLGEEPQALIPGLELFNATSAMLIRAECHGQKYVVGLCNKAHPISDTFLAKDGMALDSIVELLAIGVRVGEHRLRELEGIQETTAAISVELDPEELLSKIVERAAVVFNTPCTSLMLWDETADNLITKASCGLSHDYVRDQRIARDLVFGVAERVGGFRPLVTANLQDTPFGDIDLIQREQLHTVLTAPLLIGREHAQTGLAIPLAGSKELIGILNIYSKGSARHFTAHEQRLAEIFANHAAIAMRNATLYGAMERRSRHLQALHEASKAITAGFSGNWNQALGRIVEQAVEYITTVDGPKARWGYLVLHNKTGNELQFESVYPPEILPDLHVEIGATRSLDPAETPDGRIGISGRVVFEGQPRCVRDVEVDPDYVELNTSTRSQLAVPLCDDDRIAGVLSVESDRVGAFDKEDEEALASLAELAVIAMKNTQQAEVLGRTNAVALLGAWGADVVHDVNREVGSIRRAVYLLLQDDRLPSGARERIKAIDRYADRLALPELPEQVPEPGQFLDFRQAPVVDEVLQAELQDLQLAHPAITFRFEPNCEGTRIAIHESWLRRLLRHLVRNAVKAIPEDRENRLVTVCTCVQGSMVEVQVEDSGKGVRPTIQSVLFRQPIPHPDGRPGRGLLLVRFLAERHGGYAKLVWSEQDRGACFAFGVPMA